MRDTIVWFSVLMLAAARATTEEQQNKTEESKKQDKRGILVLGYVPGNFHNNNHGFSSIVLHNAAKVPFNTVTQQVPVHVPQPDPVPIRRPIPIPIPAPYTVNVPRPVPVPVPVHHPIPVPVPQPYNVPIPQPVPVHDSPGVEGDSGTNAEFGVKIIDSTKQTHDNGGSDDSSNHQLAPSESHNYNPATKSSQYNLGSNTVISGHSSTSGDNKLSTGVTSKTHGTEYVSNYNAETLKYVQGSGYNTQHNNEHYNSNYGNNPTTDSSTGTKKEDTSADNYLSVNLKEGISYDHVTPGTNYLAQNFNYHKGTGEESEKDVGYNSGQSENLQLVPPESQTVKVSGPVPSVFVGHPSQPGSGYFGHYPGYNLKFNLEPTGENHAENAKQDKSIEQKSLYNLDISSYISKPFGHNYGGVSGSSGSSHIPQSVTNFEKSHDSGITQVKYISNYAPVTGYTDQSQGHYTGSLEQGTNNNADHPSHSQSSATETQKSTVAVQHSNLYRTDQSSTYDTQSTGQHRGFPKGSVEGSITHNKAYNSNSKGYSQALRTSSESHNPSYTLGPSQQNTVKNGEGHTTEYGTLTLNQGHNVALNGGKHGNEYQHRLTLGILGHGHGHDLGVSGSPESSEYKQGSSERAQQYISATSSEGYSLSNNVRLSQQENVPAHTIQYNAASVNGHRQALESNSPIHTTLYNTDGSGHESKYTIGTRIFSFNPEYRTGSAGLVQGHASSGSLHQDKGHTSLSNDGDTFGYYTGIIVHGHPNKPASGSNTGYGSGQGSQHAQGITSGLDYKPEEGYTGTPQTGYKPEYPALINDKHSSNTETKSSDSGNNKYQAASESQVAVQDSIYDAGSHYQSTPRTGNSLSQT